jgi:deazaflavin-dependent oxidoreductase (nitroreductase family)
MSAHEVTTRRESGAQRVANTMLRRMLRRGRGPAFMQLLTVRGRNTGKLRSTPVVPVVHDDRRWLVSPFGDVEWVRNARAAGRVQLARGDDRDEYHVRELDAHEATPVLRRYLSMPSARFVRRDFDVSSTSDDAAIAAEAPRHPVFRLTPVEEHRSEDADGLGRVGRRD